MLKYLPLVFLFLMFSCATTKKYSKPLWTKNIVKLQGDYLVAVGVSEGFGSKGREMAQIDAHKKIARVLDSYVEAYVQSYKRYIKNSSGKNEIFGRISKTHIHSEAYLNNLEIMKDENGKELSWFDRRNDRYYIKIGLNLKKVDKKLENNISKKLPDEMKVETVKNLEMRSKRAHERLKEKLKNMKWE